MTRDSVAIIALCSCSKKSDKQLKDTQKPDPFQHKGCPVVLQATRTTYNVPKYVLPFFINAKARARSVTTGGYIQQTIKQPL